MGKGQHDGRSVGVALTIYNQNFALVRDRRAVALEAGRNSVVIEDVAAQIDPTSVHFKSLTAPQAVVVREQNYQYDLINPTTLLNKSVGKRVTIRQNLADGNSRLIEGTIVTPVSVTVAQTGTRADYGSGLAYSGMVVRTDEGALILSPEGEITLHEMPEGLIPRPRLTWLADSAQAGEHDIEVSYITHAVTWKADYVLVMSENDSTVDLTGWVTLDNQSGATYENASLQLIAGDVRRIQEERHLADFAAPAATLGLVAGSALQFEEQPFFEYHLYTLDGATTVRQNEQKQMTLLNAVDVPAEKKFMYDGRRGFWGIGNVSYQPNESYDTSGNTKVNLYVVLENRQPQLGMPLPKGKMRFYKADNAQRLQFIGEDQIDHTAKDETLRLYLGDAFDVTGEHRRMDFRRLGKHLVEETFEITLRNHRAEPTRVHVTEHVWADWSILNNTHPFTKLDARTLEFTVTVPQDGEAKLKYSLRTKW